ncbi:MAG: ORF6N domain-containing protein [Acidobacteria bacterium]|nr:ORF6N domain-containing protein [Acidobacteriota bacterium]
MTSKRLTMKEALITVPVERVEQAIFVIRGERVIIDSDLAKLYGVTTARLNQQVRRNGERFPDDFMFEITKEENESLMLQFATSQGGRGGRRKLPLVFTEHGAIMAANVLNSKRAVRASVQVVRAFVRLRQMVASNAELARKLDELEKRYDAQFKVVFEAIRQLMTPPEPKQKQIGFQAKSLKR